MATVEPDPASPKAPPSTTAWRRRCSRSGASSPGRRACSRARPRLPARRRPPPHQGRPRDWPRPPHHQDDRRRARRHLSTASSSRPTSSRRTWSARASTGRDSRRVRHRARPRLLQLPARGRDQPRAGQGAVGAAARGHAGAPGDDGPHDLPRARPVPRHGDPESDRVGGHVSATGGPDRPLHARLLVGYPGHDDELTVVQRSLVRRPTCGGRSASTTCSTSSGRWPRFTSTPR